MIMRCIAVDDEPLALMQISKYIRKTTFLELCGNFRNAASAASWLAENDTDLIFADINMPRINGIDFIRSLNKKILVIFTTAYSEYALEGFRADATDYLLKPIGYEDFLHSAEKAYRQFQLLGGFLKLPEDQRMIFVKSEYKVIPVDVIHIQYIESRGEYVRIYVEGTKPIMTLGSLKSYEEKLPSDIFFRVHRSYIINKRRVKSIERKRINMVDGTVIPVGNLYEDKLRKILI